MPSKPFVTNWRTFWVCCLPPSKVTTFEFQLCFWFADLGGFTWIIRAACRWLDRKKKRRKHYVHTRGIVIMRFLWNLHAFTLQFTSLKSNVIFQIKPSRSIPEVNIKGANQSIICQKSIKFTIFSNDSLSIKDLCDAGSAHQTTQVDFCSRAPDSKIGKK